MHFIEKKGLLFMKQGSKIGIVCCSNGLRPEQAETIKMLVQILEKSGLEVDLSPYLYGDENGQAGRIWRGYGQRDFILSGFSDHCLRKKAFLGI